MNINYLKQAAEQLVEATQNEDIKSIIDDTIDGWNFHENFSLNCIFQVKSACTTLFHAILQDNEDDATHEALQTVAFDKIFELYFPKIQRIFNEQDTNFYTKCKLLRDLNVSVEEFGASENYDLPLAAAIVELSVIDLYRKPTEKMDCLYRTYDLVFAEIKAALVAMIARYSDKDNDIPIVNNSDIIPVLMMVIIKSKLHYMFSNLFYIKSLDFKLHEQHIICDIFKSFESAVEKLLGKNVVDLKPKTSKIIRNIGIEEYFKIASSPEDVTKTNSVVDAENQRILNLITRSTDEM